MQQRIGLLLEGFCAIQEYIIITPDKIPHEDYIVAPELAVKSLISSAPQQLIQEMLSMAYTLRSEVVNILTKQRPPKQNIGKENRSLLKNLAKNKDILILQADKGKATVVMDKCDYIVCSNILQNGEGHEGV